MGDFATEFVFDGSAGLEDDWGEEESCEGEEGEEESCEGEEGEEGEGESLVEKILRQRKDSADSPRRSERLSSLPSYFSRWQDARAQEAAAIEEEKKERFRKLMGMQLGKGDGESIKTILSADEEEEKKSEEDTSSAESVNLCLKTVEISDSQLKLLNIYRDYPVPEDPGLVPAFWVLHPPPMNYKDDGIQKFEDLVKESGLVPSNSIKEMLQTDTVNLRYYGVDPRVFRALCKAIPNNTNVQNLDFRDNFLSPGSCCHLANLLTSNGIISRLDLSGCKIEAEGAKKLQRGISAAPALVELDLRRCNLGDEGLRHVAFAICYSHALEDVNLSDNYLSDDSADSLHAMFLQAEVLRRLDLSWNSLYTREFATTFFRGLARNETIQFLDMSWNGLGKDCVTPLCLYLANSNTLREFDLSDNRFTAAEGTQIAKALAKNTGLEVLRLGNNPLMPAGALALVKALAPEKSPDLRLQTLDLKNVWAYKDVLPSLEKLKIDRPRLDVTLGGILGNYKLLGPDSRKVFLKRANFEAASPKKKKDRRNFGHFVLTLTDEVVSRAAFKDSVMQFKLKLTDSLIDEIMNAFAMPKSRVDQSALKAFYLKEYPDTHPPPPKTPKSSRKKKKAAENKAAESGPPA